MLDRSAPRVCSMAGVPTVSECFSDVSAGRARRACFTHAQRTIFAQSRAWTCAMCHAKDLYNRAWDIDHITEISDGGANHPDNLQLLCAGCHAVKTHRNAVRRNAERRSMSPSPSVTRASSPRAPRTVRTTQFAASTLAEEMTRHDMAIAHLEGLLREERRHHAAEVARVTGIGDRTADAMTTPATSDAPSPETVVKKRGRPKKRVRSEKTSQVPAPPIIPPPSPVIATAPPAMANAPPPDRRTNIVAAFWAAHDRDTDELGPPSRTKLDGILATVQALGTFIPAVTLIEITAAINNDGIATANGNALGVKKKRAQPKQTVVDDTVLNLTPETPENVAKTVFEFSQNESDILLRVEIKMAVDARGYRRFNYNPLYAAMTTLGAVSGGGNKRTRNGQTDRYFSGVKLK